MPVFDLYSKRQKRKRGEIPDVYVYDNLPEAIRVQIVHLWNDLLGEDNDFQDPHKGVEAAYKFIVTTLRREYGVFELIPPQYKIRGQNEMEELFRFFLSEDDVERCLDTIELTFRYADTFARKWDYCRINDSSSHVDDCIKELNDRFKEHGIGYEFTDGEIIRIDSELIHQEVVKPALTLLNRDGFQGPRDEFLNAYEHYRYKKYKEALSEALKAFESTMKAICEKKGWTYSEKDTSKRLINTCIKNNLFPTYYQNHMAALSTLLESSVPTIRNKEGGHGQGDKVKSIDGYVVAYALHMTASAIVLLAEAEKNIKHV